MIHAALVVLAPLLIAGAVIGIRDSQRKKRPPFDLTLEPSSEITVNGTTWVVWATRYDTNPGALTVEMRPKKDLTSWIGGAE